MTDFSVFETLVESITPGLQYFEYLEEMVVHLCDFGALAHKVETFQVDKIFSVRDPDCSLLQGFLRSPLFQLEHNPTIFGQTGRPRLPDLRQIDKFQFQEGMVAHLSHINDNGIAPLDRPVNEETILINLH